MRLSPSRLETNPERNLPAVMPMKNRDAKAAARSGVTPRVAIRYDAVHSMQVLSKAQYPQKPKRS